MSEDPTSEARPGALNRRESNAATVKTIRTGGHIASAAISGALIAKGAVGAFGSGEVAGVICYVAPFAAGIAGVMAGSALAEKLRVDEKLLDLMGKPRQAAPGPHPAHVGHKIAHSHQFAGAIGGLLGGVLVGAAVGLGVATIVTGGLLAPFLASPLPGWRYIIEEIPSSALPSLNG